MTTITMTDRIANIRDNAARLAMSDPDELEAVLDRETIIDLEVATRQAAHKLRDYHYAHDTEDAAYGVAIGPVHPRRLPKTITNEGETDA